MANEGTRHGGYKEFVGECIVCVCVCVNVMIFSMVITRCSDSSINDPERPGPCDEEICGFIVVRCL